MMKKVLSFNLVAFVLLALVSPHILLADNDDTIEAEAQTDLLVEELLGAVTEVTAAVTPENTAELSALVSDLMASQDSYRLIGTELPLGANSDVLDRFERRALRHALRGKMTQKVIHGELRTVVPLTFSQTGPSANCAVCHGNYNDLVDGPDDTVVVGAASFRVPLYND